MKIQYCSDLHLEFPLNKRFMEANPLTPVGDILIMAGDILPFGMHKKQTAFIDFIADNFEMVYWVPGNHEYYGYDIATVADPLLEKLRGNVWLLNNQAVTYNNVLLIASTLWSKIHVTNAWDIQQSISDFYSIRWQDRKFTADHFNQLHEQAVTFLQNAFKEKSTATDIVITHHVPTLYQYPEQYRNSPLNDAFVTELYDFIHDSGASYWIYGHHHNNVPTFSVGNTKLLTNQLGYVEYGEYGGFNRSAIIDI
jgi:predicted phosphohydrolase